MIEKFVTQPKTLSRLQSGLLGPHLPAIASTLDQLGYSTGSIRLHLRAADHFGTWLLQQKIDVQDINDTVVDCYLLGLDRLRSACTPQGRFPHTALGLRHLLEILRQFEPKKDDVMFADKPVIPGSPERPMGDPQSRSRSKKLNPQVADYAKMLHKEHGMNLDQTLKLGQKINVTPMETAAVDKLRVKGAGELAALAPLDGEKFASAYIETMINGHTEVLGMIDNQLLKNAENSDLKKHLTETRGHVASHLEAAKKLQAGSRGRR